MVSFRSASTTVFTRAVASTHADLGGTELELALRETCAIPMPDAHDGTVDILLITDGEVWNIDQTVECAQRSGHRIHAIGVGSAPADSLLRELAERTDGSCELVTPNETIADAMSRTFRRLRGGRVVGIEVQWPQTPLWQSVLPDRLLDGETVHIFARLPHRPESPPVLRWTIEGRTQEDQPATLVHDDSGTVTRMGGARRLAECPLQDPQTREALALRYQLVSACTSLILVHERADDQKAEGLPLLQQVAQMHAAGHGGAGSVLGAVAGICGILGPGILRSLQQRSVRSAALGFMPPGLPIKEQPNNFAAHFRALPGQDTVGVEIPAFLRRTVEDAEPSRRLSVTPRSLLEALEKAAATGMGWQDTVADLDRKLSHSPALQRLLKLMSTRLTDRAQAWAVLLEWLVTRLTGEAKPVRHAERLLRRALASVSDDDKTACHRMLDQQLPQLRHDSWEL